MIERFGKASVTLTREESTACEKLAEVLKQYLSDTARTCVRQAAGLPVMFCYGSDGTPLRVQHYISASVGERRIHRRGGRGVETLIQKGLLYFRAI